MRFSAQTMPIPIAKVPLEVSSTGMPGSSWPVASAFSMMYLAGTSFMSRNAAATRPGRSAIRSGWSSEAETLS